MDGRCAFIACLLCGVLIANSAYALDEKNYYSTPDEILIIENKELKQIEVRNPSNASGTLPGSSTVIHQGNNVYIKPKIILGSPFTSCKQGSNAVGCCDNIPVTPKVPDEEINLVLGKIPAQQLPPIIIPPVLLPPVIEDNISITPRLPLQAQIPIAFNNSCLPMHFSITAEEINVPMLCPPYVLNVPPQTKFPTVVNTPIVIPKPPVLPPINLPKLPIQVIIRKPIFTRLPGLVTIPDQPIIVPSVCPPIAKCIPLEKNMPSNSDILTVIFEKFKNLLSIPNRIDFSQFFVPDDEVLKDELPPAFPTVCAQGIIAERIVPNIIENDEVKVFMSPIFPSQLTRSGFYRK